MRPIEPYPSSTTPLYFIGRNSHGEWVVRDRSGARGGLFIGRAEALRFAMFENGNQPQAVIMVPGVLELDLNLPDPQSDRLRSGLQDDRSRRAA